MVTTRRASLGLLASLCAASPALALDRTPDATRILGDPGFLPTAGQVSGSFGYTYSANLYDTQTTSFEIPVLGSPPKTYPSSFDRSGNTFLPALSYGITDDIAVTASLNFGNTRNVEHYSYETLVFLPSKVSPSQLLGPAPPLFTIYDPGASNGGGVLQNPFASFKEVRVNAVAHFHAIGAEDPAFGLTWRVIDQRRASPVSVDLIGSYSPDIFQGRSANDRQTGSLATGGQAGTAELAVTRETGFLTLRAYGIFGYDGRRNEVDGGNAQDLRSAPHAVYSAGLQSQARLLPWLALNAGVTAQQAVRYDRAILSPAETTPQTIRPGGNVSPYVGLLVPLIANHLVTEVQYQHVFEADGTVEEAFQATRTYKEESNEFTARVLFAFGGAAAPLPPANPPTQPSPLAPENFTARTYLVFFDWDRADLTARARQIVAQAAQAATHTTTTRIDVRGYTDLAGSATYNQALSLRRARSVQAELQRDGIARDEIAIHGYGETNPLVATAAGIREPQNRRVEIVFQ